MYSMWDAPSDRDYYGDGEEPGCDVCLEDAGNCVCAELAADFASLCATEPPAETPGLVTQSSPRSREAA